MPYWRMVAFQAQMMTLQYLHNKFSKGCKHSMLKSCYADGFANVPLMVMDLLIFMAEAGTPEHRWGSGSLWYEAPADTGS